MRRGSTKRASTKRPPTERPPTERPQPDRPPARPRRRAQPATIGRWVRWRIAAVGTLFALLLAGIAVKAYGIQVEEHAKYRRIARRQHIRMVEVPAPRGNIYDTTGRELAVTANTDSVYASPKRVTDVVGEAAALSRVLPLDRRELEAKLADNHDFVWIERHVSDAEAKAVRALHLPGVDLTPEPERFYPASALAGPVLGFAGVDGRGLDGVELSMNDLLTGKRARFAALRDARGHVMLPGTPTGAEPGASITLTIDRYIQFVAERALAKAVTDNKAKDGELVVLDVHTGAVLAMANWPNYDPNAPAAGLHQHARDRAITDVYEPGSVMKVFTIAAALDAGVVKPSDTFDVHTGCVRIDHHSICDSFHDTVLTVGGVLKRSSNLGAIQIIHKVGKQRMHDALLRFRFGHKTGIELPGERAGVIRPTSRWGPIGFATLAFGYGMLATPLQVAAGIAAVGDGGVYHDPRIIKKVVSASGTVLYRHHVPGRRIMKASTARKLLPMMASVFDKGWRHGGTARSVNVNGYRCGGKTGTAYKVDPKTGKYGKHLYVASFAGLAPIDNPRIAVLVVVDEPSAGKYYGADVAAPAFAEVVAKALRYLGVPPSAPAVGTDASKDETGGRHRDKASKLVPPIPAPPAGADATTAADHATSGEVVPGAPSPGGVPAGAVIVPDFTGMGIGRALAAARRAGLDVDTVGGGVAVEQYPSPGPATPPVRCRILFAPRGAGHPKARPAPP